MYIWVIISALDDMVGIDDDCVFGNQDAADEKCEELIKKYPDQYFTVSRLTIPHSVELDIVDSRLPDAVQAHADAMWEIGKAMGEMSETMKEFVKCACSYKAFGSSAVHPTIIVKKED